MTLLHLARRQPKRSTGLSWSRMATSDGAFVTWRLFRRDHRGALHMSVHTFAAGDRQYIAGQLRRARHTLRDRVDEIDLAAMGVAA